MASIPMDIVEIRRTVYGKTMREPIADACIHLKDKYRGSVIKRLDNVEIRAAEITEDDYYADSGSTIGLTISNIEDSDYLLTDSRMSDSASFIEETDYSFNLNDTLWSLEYVIEEDRNYSLILHY